MVKIDNNLKKLSKMINSSFTPLLVSLSFEIEKLLKEYVKLNDKRLKVAGTFKSLFQKIDFKELNEEGKFLKKRFEKSSSKIEELRKEKTKSFSEVENEFFEVLSNYFNLLFDTVRQLSLILDRLHKKSLGVVISAENKLSFLEYLRLEKSYKRKAKKYFNEGEKLNQAFRKLRADQY